MEKDLELAALARLGVTLPPSPPAPAPGESPLDALVRTGAVKRHQAAAARAYAARNGVLCGCGARGLRGEGGAPSPCPACGAPLSLASASVGPTPTANEAAAILPVAGAPRSPDQSPSPGSSSAARRARFSPGASVGPLVLVDKLGAGASGVVWRAHHATLGREVAVKLVAAGRRDDDRRRRRFEREVEALARLDHPGIVRVHSAFEVEGALVVEMQLVDGETLSSRIERDGPLPWREACLLVATLARAVAHAHGQGVLHRDLKPENVLVARASGAPLVADFGLARLTDQASSLTGPGALIGTPVAMAPEAFRGDVGAPADVYGLGVILYFALTGALPYAPAEGEHLAALWRQIEKGRCPPTQAPSPVEAVRARAMAIDAADRHPSALALADDLERVAAGRPPAPAPCLRARVRRRLARAAALCALALAAGVAGLVRLDAAGQVEPPPPPPRPERPGASATGASLLLAALRTFKTPGGEPEPSATDEARRRALAALLVATRPGAPDHDLLGGALDDALARGPDAPVLRLVRAQRDRARGAELDPADLAAVASAAPLARPSDAEVLATHALGVGLRGGIESRAAVDATGALASAFPASRAAVVLHAVTLAAGGDPADRPALEAALRAAGPQAPDPASDLRRALSLADELVRGLGARDGHVSVVGPALTEVLARLVVRLPRSPALILAPLEAPVSRGLHDGSFIDLANQELRRAVQGPLYQARQALPPRLLALADITIELEGEEEDWFPKGVGRSPWQAIIGAAPALAQVDPLLGVAALAAATHRAAEGHITGHPLPRATLLELRARCLQVEAGLRGVDPTLFKEIEARTDLAASGLDVTPPTPRLLNQTELMWVLFTVHRMNTDRATLEAALAIDLPDAAARDAGLELAAERQWRALSASRIAGLAGKTHSLAAGRYARLCLVRDRIEDIARAYPWLDEREAIEAERLRRGGDPTAALAKVAEGLSSGPNDGRRNNEEDLRAVQAMALADLGRFEDAIKVWTRLQAIESHGVVCEAFTVAKVAAHIRAAEAKQGSNPPR